MILTLEVMGPGTGKPGTVNRKVLRAAGGTIGRLPDNYCVLPDACVSGRHALIRYTNGVFYIEDTSTNGVFINSPENRLVRGKSYALKSGDLILIDPYEIRASVTSETDDTLSALGDVFKAQSPASVASDPFAFGDPLGRPSSAAPKPAIPPLPAELGRAAEAAPGEEVDPLNLLGLGPKRAPMQNAPKAADLAHNSVLSDHYQAPARLPAAPAPPSPSSGALIPDDYDPLVSEERPLPRPAPPQAAPRPETGAQRQTAASARLPIESAPLPPQPAPLQWPGPITQGAKSPGDVPPPAPQPFAPSTSSATVSPPAGPKSPALPAQTSPPSAAVTRGSADDAGLAAVLAAAGLANVAVPADFARSFGQILRVVVSGVVDVLQARRRIKDEFRMDMTTFRKADNNPLKFSANVDDALHNLLVKRNAAYLGPVDAFEDAFEDLRNHQLATLAGVRVAFDAMLAEFDPDRLEEEFDRPIKQGSLLSVPAKFRYWALYRDRFHDMVKDAEASFRELFGDQFAKAYEEQLERLKTQSRGEKR